MWGYDITLDYDTTVLTATTYSSYDPFFFSWPSIINDTAGYVSVSYSMTLGEPVGFSTVDPAPIVRIDFTVDALGTSLISFFPTPLREDMSDVYGNSIPYREFGGYFSNVPVVEVGWIGSAVTDSLTGLPLEGAIVSANGYSDLTHSSGFYTLEVSPGTYDVTAEMAGYISQTATDVYVSAGDTIVQDFALSPSPIDTTPPTITINESTERDHLHSETLTLDFSAEDPSGVASITATLDGESVMSGDEIELYTLSLGSHTLVVTAVDTVGNSGTEMVTLSVIATVSSLQDLVTMFFESGYFYSPKGMYTSLIQKLYAAERYIDAGQIGDAKGVLGAFINHLDAQSGKHVDDYAANILIADAQYVIDNL